tara:strand:+ start:43 stop:402 length:360 start_codon:yes stop_codon:yes gene_type:complete
MIIETNPLKLEYVIIIFLLILAIVLLFYKSIEPELPISQNNPKLNPKPILKKQSVQITPKPNVKFYDVRMSKLSNDIKIEKNQEPTSELLSQYKPAKEIVPTDNIYNCREQNKPIRFNI